MLLDIFNVSYFLISDNTLLLLPNTYRSFASWGVSYCYSIMSDQANHVSSYWMNKLHAHVARVNTNHNEGRAEKGINGEMLSGQKPQGTFRVRDNDMKRIKKRHDAKRDRKVRFEGFTENGSVDGSLPCQSDDFHSSANR
jgi:hypothetical protein